MAIRWDFWLLLVATVALYLVIVLWSLPIIAAGAGGLPPFDLRPLGCATDQARAFLAALGDAGLAQYQGPQRGLDTVYPGLLAATLILAAAVSGLVVLGAVFDVQENIAVADLLSLGGGGIDAEVAGIASLLTLLKSLAPPLVFAALLTGMAVALWQRQRR